MSESVFVKSLLSTAGRYPDRVAVVAGDGTEAVTYSAFLTLSRRVTAFIKAKGVAPGSFILVRMPSSVEFLAAETGIWLAGCAAVPVSDTFPEKRIRDISEHCNSPLAIDLELMGMIRGYEPVDGKVPDSDDDAMLLYTSGSTGLPKAVLHPFSTFDNCVPRSLVPGMDMDGIVFGTAAPFHFAASKWLYDVLLAGGTVHIYGEEQKNDVRLLEDYIERNCITVSHISPAVLKLFRNRSPFLKVVMTAGEKLTTQYSRDGYRLFNMFGQTEVMLNVLFYEVPNHRMDRVPLGKPFNGVEYSVLDGNLNPVAAGQIGELCLKGNFCRGYLHDVAATSGLYAGGWLHTGDLVYVDDDGNVCYVNRKDWMIKINGQRVEPGEIEAAMMRIEGVETAIADGVADERTGSSYIVGYYIRKEGSGVTEEMIRKNLIEKLPRYMVPRFLYRLDAVPLNANGKLDRKALPAVDHRNCAAEYAAPSDEAERRLCDVFADVLGLERVGVNDDFFHLGGDSIKVMELILDSPDPRIVYSDVYEFRTPGKIASALASRNGPAELSSGAEEAPLTEVQKGILFECMKHTGKAVYNNPFLFRLGDGIDMPRMKNALERTVEAHPALCSRIFISEDGCATVKRDRSFAKDCCSLETLSESGFEDLKNSLLQPFELLGGRLFRIRLFCVGTRKYLFFDFHHIIFDGTSMKIFIEDADRAYGGEILVEEDFNGFDYAVVETRMRGGEVSRRAGAWFDSVFSDVVSMSIPAFSHRLPEQSYSSFTLPLNVDAAAVDSFCSKCGITPNVLATAAFGRLLASYTGENHSEFVTVFNGRKNSRSLHTVAMMVKPLPVSCRFNRNDSLKDTLLQVRDSLLGAMANDAYSIADLAADKGLGSEVIFAYQGDIFETPRLGGETMTDEEFQFIATGALLCVDVFSGKGGMRLRTEYRCDLYDGEFIRQFSECYRNILASMMAPDGDTAGVSLLDGRMKDRILELSSGRVLESDTDVTVCALVRAAAAAHRNDVALVDGTGSYTYGELELLSDCVAAALVSDGVGPGAFVAIRTGRSREFVAAALGVMKAGAAYVPLDPEYPQERIRFMLEDSGAKVVADEEYVRNAGMKYAVLCETGDGFADVSSPESPAYMIYTSGSTGTPKGVVICHRALATFVQTIVRQWRIGPSSRISCHSSFSFDASVEDLYPALTVGGTVYVIPEELRKDIDGLYSYIVENGISGGCYTTGFGILLLEFYPDLPVDYLVVGGECLTSVPVCSCRFINTYGPTEFTVDATWMEFEKGRCYETIPIGRPMDGCRAYIVDRMGALLPPGVPGEICLAGPQMAAGYWHRDDQTAGKFRPADFLEGELLYHTGDIGRYNGDGMLEFVGRMDTQVKLRGFRIETGEIDAALARCPGVVASVTALRTLNGRNTLVSWFTATEVLRPYVLKDRLSRSLPEYMIPDIFIQVGEFPHLPNGKVDTSALVLNDISRKRSSYKAPANDRERILVDIIESITGIVPVGVNDELTEDCGLSSIQLVRFLFMAQQRGLKFSMSDIYEKKTVSGLIAAGRRDFYEYVRCETREDAPVVVLVCGYVPNHPYYEDVVSCMRKDYSLLIFDDFFNNFDETDLDFTEGRRVCGRNICIDTLTGDYMAVMDKVPGGRTPSFVTGVCYGADIAFALVGRIKEERGLAIPLMAFDPIFPRNTLTGIPEEIKDDSFLVAKYRISDCLSRSMASPSYSGKIVFAFPADLYFRKIEELPDLPYSEDEWIEYVEMKRRNEMSFRERFPDAVFYVLDGHHYNFVNTERMPSIMKLMHENFD